MSIFAKNLFSNRSAIVTGGGTGIGFAISRELVSLGCDVLIASRKLENLRDAQRELTQYRTHESQKIEYVSVNIRDEQSIKALFSFAKEKFGRLDFLVNNSGGQFPAPAQAISTNGWKAVIDLNLTGTFVCCREAFDTFFQDQGHGRIVTITCDVENGFPGMSHTGAARAGVITLTKTLAIEWAGNGVQINCVAPGIIFNESADKHYKTQTDIPDLLASEIPNIPARRLGTVEEVSSAVLFLLSPGSQYITGINLAVDGGSRLTRPGGRWFTEHAGWPKYQPKF